MLDTAAEAYFEAAHARDPARIRAAIAGLVPSLEPAVRAVTRRQQTLLRRGRIDENDVVQRVFEKLLTHPPDNPGNRPAAAVLLAWAKTVAIHHLLDVARHFDPIAAPAGDDASAPAPDMPAAPIQEEAVVHRERLRLAQTCADTHLARHKHLREVFYALVEDPDLSARELAARIGLAAEGGDPAAAKKAEQLVFKLRERVHVKLAECLDRHERARPQGGGRW
ncbi:Hypothetical protein A7982_04957 [Minicystis rosea]|nr:Hypothetical protein A7982_04957 [Minicystis rosea]